MPPPKRGLGKSRQFRLFLCIYSWLSKHFSPFYSPHPKLPVPNRASHACWLILRVLGDFKGFPTIVLILKQNIKVFVSVFLVFCGKNDVEALSNFTSIFEE